MEHWDVREYVRRTGVGAREYGVVQGSSIEDVYRSAEREEPDGRRDSAYDPRDVPTAQPAVDPSEGEQIARE